ncbi:MAG: hypothetical protein ABL962_03805, partial [Fimbriimonadaceae bacterium]
MVQESGDDPSVGGVCAMKIISKFHDYYDSAMGYGIDPNLVYRREPALIELPLDTWEFDVVILQGPGLANNYAHVVSYCVLGFCGRVFTVTIEGRFFDVDALSSSSPGRVALSAKESATMIAESAIGGSQMRWSKNTLDRIERYRAKQAAIEKEYQGGPCSPAIFRYLDAPVFISRRLIRRSDWGVSHVIQIITNPRIASLGMAKHFDAFAAFQEISMFLGSALAVEDRAPKTVGDDKIIAASKGFDDQSFRTLAP